VTQNDAEELAAWRAFAERHGFKGLSDIEAALSVLLDKGTFPDGTTAGSIESYAARFYTMQEEAKGYGIQSVVGLLTTDPLTLQDQTHEAFIGSYFAILGLLHVTARRIERDCCSAA
jgi:hypothetical protein